MSCQSSGNTAKLMPDSPPIVNVMRNATANIIEVVKRIRPPYIVAVQLKILIPVGTAISMLETPKARLAMWPMPTANM